MIDPEEIRKMLARLAKLHATPIDFEDLERKGILSKAPKEGKGWYKVNDLPPEHVGYQIKEIKWNPKTGESWAKFRKPSKNASWAKSAKALKK